MRHTNLISSAIVLTFVLLFTNSTSAQNSIPIPAPPRPQVAVCSGVPNVSIRNLQYADYTRYSRLSPTTVALGGYIKISTTCMPFDGQIVVTLQDANRPPNSSGVTAFRLTNVTRSGGVVTAQMPNLAMFRNRTFYVALFVYGQPRKTAAPGTVTIQ